MTMARKKNKFEVYPNIRIEKTGAEGNSIGYLPDERVVFVPFTAPGDVVDIVLTKRRKTHAQGRMVRLVSPSPIRENPSCPHFGTCGGCKWQHLPYQSQLQTKQTQVYDQLKRIGGLTVEESRNIIGSEEIYAYRNKLEFTFSNQRWLTEEEILRDNVYERRGLGFHIPGMFDKVLDIRMCLLQEDTSNDIRNFVREWTLRHPSYTFFDLREQTGFLRNLMIRNTSTGEWMLVVVFAYDDPPMIRTLLSAIEDRFPSLTSLMYIVNSKRNDSFLDQDVHLFSGRDHLIEEMEGLFFKIGPKSFYQTNSHQAHTLYSIVRDLADLHGHELVYDLYTGTGTIASFLARNAAKVIGIEYVEDAILDARENAKINHISNVTYFAGDMKDILTRDFVRRHGQPDVVVTDPPRAGMHDSVIQVLRETFPSRIVYVSCNPATQARDVSLLSDLYSVRVSQPVDMFPHTHHVENVLLLTRR